MLAVNIYTAEERKKKKKTIEDATTKFLAGLLVYRNS